jgi:hypothetical protein
MAFVLRASSTALILASVALAGCADGNSSIFTTGALGSSTQTAAAPEPKVDPMCVTLTSRIDGLRKEGIADKIEKAAAKKYKMTQADLTKAGQRMSDPPATLQNREVDYIADFLVAKVVGQGPMDHAKCIEFWGRETEACSEFPK